MKVLLGIGGASGSIYGIRLLEELHKSKVELHLIVSEGAKKIIEHETNYTFNDLKKKTTFCYDNDDMFAGPASGSFKLDAMIFCHLIWVQDIGADLTPPGDFILIFMNFLLLFILFLFFKLI